METREIRWTDPPPRYESGHAAQATLGIRLCADRGDGCCECGASVTDECPECQGTGYHLGECSLIESAEAR